jgi:hypothetical protein
MSDLKNFNELSPEEKETVMTAIDSLCERNPDITKQLTKIADIKKNLPLVWKMVLQKLGV